MGYCHTIFLSLHFFLCFPLLFSANASVVQDTCNSIATNDPNISYGFCVEALEVVPESSSADEHGLAIVALNLSISNATSTLSAIGMMMQMELNLAVTECLETCKDVYGNAIDRLTSAMNFLSSGRYVDAVTYLSAANDAATNCDDAFKEMTSEPPSELAAEDSDYLQLTTIALAITATLN